MISCDGFSLKSEVNQGPGTRRERGKYSNDIGTESKDIKQKM